ncbi:efflux RND transporter periplasmic adaptor subunit [Shimia biformata]|uniref:efflux RND transporter periplasmic adaptor subunit n=1 Tax=Shimia biformata TaxID=1294299 RepID=UPI00194DF1C4|nr:efflux RND transporter periplasmic adaptor subunit [Shimia biformata]
MRPIPMITAILVTAFLFYVVVERDTLMAFASADAGSVQATETVATVTEEVAQSDAVPAVGVIAIHSTASQIDSAVVLRGETRAARSVEVRAETSARVISEPLRKGASVDEGAVLCQLELGTREASLAEANARLEEAQAKVPEAQARLVEATARLSEARLNQNAANKLSEGGYASETRVASAEAAVQAALASVQSAQSGLRSANAGIESAEAAVAAAEREIGRLTITAPFSGVLETDTAELGSLLQPGSLCGTVMQMDPIKIVGFVPETEVNRVNLGASAGARMANGDVVTGTVGFIARSADPVTRTFMVEIDAPNTDLRIRDGQTAEIAIQSDGATAHLVPQSALTLNDHGTLGVRVVAADNTAQFAAVELVRDSADGVWVDGLPEQVDVIVVGQEYVTDGVIVAPSFEGLTK